MSLNCIQSLIYGLQQGLAAIDRPTIYIHVITLSFYVVLLISQYPEIFKLFFHWKKNSSNFFLKKKKNMHALPSDSKIENNPGNCSNVALAKVQHDKKQIMVSLSILLLLIFCSEFLIWYLLSEICTMLLPL